MRLRWRQHKRETGLRSVLAIPRGSDLHDGEKVYAKVYSSGRQGDLWYWVAGWGSGVPHNNTCETPTSLDEAKRQALEYVKNHLSEGETR
ncbi:hypothetical protein C7402_102265 [Paraburkholderia unamae]|uniref:Uncharacterized protein n=1 Tax=Paraburkholderia unamae TaxID=219649 RepID=A0ABX5KZ55_9BURK|nr:hypothetical protein C7402_102265 [Paraburkholderia unamae]